MQLAARLRLAYASDGGFELGRPVGEVRVAIGDQLGQGPLHVEGEADQVRDQRRLRGHLPRPDQPGLVHGQPDEVELVLAVEDREVRAVSQPLGRPAEQAIADVVERPRPDPRRLGADQGVEPPDHLAGRPPGEGHEQDRLGRDPPGDQVGDAIGDDPRLARTRPRQDQVEPVGGRDRRALRVVQVEREPLGEPVAARLLQPDLPHAVRFARPRPIRVSHDRRRAYYTVSRLRRRLRRSYRTREGSPMATMDTNPAITVLRDPSVYLVGRQAVDDRSPGRVPGRPRRPSAGRPTPTRRARSSSRSPAGSATSASPAPGPAGIKPTLATSSRSATARCWSTRSST